MNRLTFALLISMMLISCEGISHFRGGVYDADTKQPITGVKVGKRYSREDHWLVRLEYDTLSTTMREALRQRGVKDDYSSYSGFPFDDTLAASRDWNHLDRYLHYTESFTESYGRFGVGPTLIGVTPFRSPGAELVFYKDGYEPVHLKIKTQSDDSIRVFMKRK